MPGVSSSWHVNFMLFVSFLFAQCEPSVTGVSGGILASFLFYVILKIFILQLLGIRKQDLNFAVAMILEKIKLKK